MISREQIAAMDALIRPHVRRTPIIEAEGMVFKLESLQHSGSFKVRGAFVNLLTRTVPAAGVVAASGGNHGAAVAYAARSLKMNARIYVPSVSSPAKISRIKSYGAELVVEGERYADALAASERWAQQSGALQVHAYDQEGALLGQGTVGMELEQQATLDTLVVAVGGGGLIGGIAAWYEGRVRIVGVEPRLAPTLTRALAAGRPVDAEAGGIAADSLAPRRVGELMYPLAERFVDRVVLVDDHAIHEAQVRLWESLRVVAEPGGAAAYAAILSGAYRAGERRARRRAGLRRKYHCGGFRPCAEPLAAAALLLASFRRALRCARHVDAGRAHLAHIGALGLGRRSAAARLSFRFHDMTSSGRNPESTPQARRRCASKNSHTSSVASG